MKKLWTSYSYSILFFIGLFLLITTMIVTNIEAPKDDYQQITVKKGDTVWDMAERFNGSKMTQTEFVSWVQENNDLHINHIKEGQTIVIPVKKMNESTEMLHLADSDK
ncbi:LysM peptidoglycan-binding domain-containing protein [Pradoshia sp. D12]|uniref:cell division suppressor protein YneA n=1 Tax=Bacillaceae TaxID=186817 RepID=UPI0011277547|nr:MULTISPECIES: LysM peptidoglycan-binding domain-containing protein [Bacillaceae]QFK71318.1 LysM peptidoglycan-binding domain-containing protein [Pradoshia sp. D12]TPF73113.1 LysM peptidoglycan-binding domain-containing protein [Bacillus sp. D12]